MSEENKPFDENLEQDVQAQDPEVVFEEFEDDNVEVLSADSELQQRIEELEAALDQSEAKVAEQQDSVIRAKAEVENMRRRSEQEIDKARKFALERLMGELLPTIDNLERAIELADKEDEALKPMLEGVELTLASFISTVHKNGLNAIAPEVGDAFNPDLHQAMSIQENADLDPNSVMLTLQKGYELNGRVVRPAMVMVSKAAAGNVDTTA